MEYDSWSMLNLLFLINLNERCLVLQACWNQHKVPLWFLSSHMQECQWFLFLIDINLVERQWKKMKMQLKAKK